MNVTWRIGTVAALMGLAVGCAARGLGSTDRQGQGGSDEQQQLSGAIFTTNEDGTRVNENQYDAKCDVYLNGGPEREGSAGLPAGDYYFMVTGPSGSPNEDPDGPSVLLSSDSIEHRMVTVDETGRFVSADDHATGENTVDGGVTVQLCEFADTPNPGCVYKVWLTPVEDYAPDEPGTVYGFQHSRSKTDNFKVCPEETPPPEEENICGNGIVEGDEECDDGNRIDDDECSNVCGINM